jgi:molecular chaperone GrpE
MARREPRRWRERNYDTQVNGLAGSAGHAGPAREQVVSRDKRKIDTSDRPRDEAVDEVATDASAPTADASQAQAEGPSGRSSPESGGSSEASGPKGDKATGSPAEAEAQMGQPGTRVADSAGGKAGATGGGKKVEAIKLAAAKDGDSASGETTDSDAAGVETVTRPAKGTSATTAGPLGAELEALRGELDERVRDLQRVTAEYANYRKRVERDRGVMAEQAVAMVLATLLPILDDLDRARDHGDLVGPFGGVAEQLTTALAKFGLTGFGEQGDAFDPTRHEAVAHQTSGDVTEPTCVAVMRRGYMLGDRLLRAALVAVADPE